MNNKTIIENFSKRAKHICPRCGKMMDYYPALSRYVDASICTPCGNDEAFSGQDDDLSTWWIVSAHKSLMKKVSETFG